MPSDSDLIVRIAAKGDGVTGDGRHVALSAPGDVLAPDGGILHGPHHQEPPCQHSDPCGGCSLQHVDEASYREFVTQRIVNALAAQKISAGIVHESYIAPIKSRRRCSIRATRLGGDLKIGFSGSGSHRIVDIQQCEILRPEIFALIGPLRTFLSNAPRRKHDITIDMTLIDQGVDVLIRNFEAESLQEREALIAFAQSQHLARLSLDNDYGPEVFWEPDPATITLGEGVPVSFPSGSFLQPTQEGEAHLVQIVRNAAGDGPLVADLFSGLGTFALAMDGTRKIYAAEASRDQIMALKMAANLNKRQVFTEHRDLFRKPLSADELNRFNTVILDPPRAGAREQTAQLAKSKVENIVYVSCNPSSFARDAKNLCAAGYVLSEIWAVGQFLWSTHVELVSRFIRPAHS